MTVINARTLIGRAVVSVADGEKVGTISNLQLDLAQRMALGLLIGGDGGIFNREKPSAASTSSSNSPLFYLVLLHLRYVAMIRYRFTIAMA